jgi:hypothetical protein
MWLGSNVMILKHFCRKNGEFDFTYTFTVVNAEKKIIKHLFQWENAHFFRRKLVQNDKLVSIALAPWASLVTDFNLSNTLVWTRPNFHLSESKQTFCNLHPGQWKEAGQQKKLAYIHDHDKLIPAHRLNVSSTKLSLTFLGVEKLKYQGSIPFTLK